MADIFMGDAQLDTTIADGYTDDYYDTPNSALSYVQGGQWLSGAGLDFAPSDLNFHADHSSLNFWMWGEQNAPMLRIQFEDGQDRVGYNFIPESIEEGGTTANCPYQISFSLMVLRLLIGNRLGSYR